MKILPTPIFCLICLLLIPSFSFAANSEMPSRGERVFLGDLIEGGNAHRSKVVADTVVLIGPWGSGAPFNGQFETPNGSAAWNGWVSHDMTVSAEAPHWQVSDYQADNLNGHGAGNLAAWCGSLDFVACDDDDIAGGYGNSWNEVLQWTGTVPDPDQPCLVQLEAWLNVDTEPAYDYGHISVAGADPLPVDYWTFDGAMSNHHLQLEFTCPPEDYTGPDGDQIALQIRFTSDGAWSDADCLFPSAGAIQIDDISVSLDGGSISTFDDFENGLDHWQAAGPVGVGDFAKIWTGLNDRDPCASNNSPQLAFIDDGVVVPGTGGTMCIDWCYGPGGYIVNNTGGLAGGDAYLVNHVNSPVIPWPGAQYDGCVLEFDVYRDETLAGDSPGIGDVWMVRSTSSSNPADIESASWLDRDSGIRSGGPYYVRQTLGVSDLLEDDRQFAQVMLGAWHWGWIWGWGGANGTPAPYLDNARLLAFEFYGPDMHLWSVRRASDNFPASGELDLEELGSNSVRFDAIVDVALPGDQRTDPGDSLFCDIAPIRDGAELMGTPRLYYKLKANPVFDPYRTSGLPNEGWTEGWRPMGSNGEPIPWGFAFDLPDTGFFFPGDVIHYFIAATDAVDGSDLQTNHVPADTTGFSDFTDLSLFDGDFTVRALPSVNPSPTEPGQLVGPEILFWQKEGYQDIAGHWRQSLNKLGLQSGVDFDRYHSRYADHTLASRASLAQVGNYGIILFSSGNDASDILGYAGHPNIKGDDLGLFADWLELGDKNILFNGNQLIASMTTDFAAQWLAVQWESERLRPLIDNQFSPLILAEAESSIFTSLDSWYLQTGCRPLWTYDAEAVTPVGTAQRLAQFADPAGLPGAYPYSAATLNQVPESSANVISLPYDLKYVLDDPGQKGPASPPARTQILGNILTFFGVPFDFEEVSDVPDAEKLTVSHFPNPFNPRTTISFHLPRAGQVTLKVFDVRGALVRNLLQEEVATGAHDITWNGNDGTGAAVSSGLYFYELRSAGQVKVGKMTLLR